MTDQFIGQTLAGKYRIEQLLREDAFGKTFKATHVLMEKSVAVKILNPALTSDKSIVAGFRQEAKMLSRLTHPHVLGITDYGTDEQGLEFLVMENFDGNTLKDLISKEGGVPVPRALNILTQVTEALAAAHSTGIIHGALRSDSILLVGSSNRDFVKVVDFDAANKTTEADLLDITAPNANPQSVAYLSPEQCTESNVADGRSDIYSLGIILYETLTGRLPFTGANANEVILKHAQDIPPSLLAIRPELPPTFEQVVQRALAKNPAQRFQNAEDFAQALKLASENAPIAAWREDETIVRPRPEVGAAANVSDGDTRWKTAFIVLAGISLLSAGLFFYTQNRSAGSNSGLMSDPNAQPVQPVNPATGMSEQNLSDFPMNVSNGTFDANLSTMPLPVPGGGFESMPSGGIPKGLYPPGQQYPGVYIDPNSNSQFMPPEIIITNINRPVGNTAGNVNRPAANTNTAANTRPAGNTDTGTETRPANTAPTPAPTVQATPAATPRTTPPPARTPAVPKPTQPVTEKSAQSVSERISKDK